MARAEFKFVEHVSSAEPGAWIKMELQETWTSEDLRALIDSEIWIGKTNYRCLKIEFPLYGCKWFSGSQIRVKVDYLPPKRHLR